MTAILYAICGAILGFFAWVAWWVHAEVTKATRSPEAQEALKRAKAERERKEEWRRKVGKP